MWICNYKNLEEKNIIAAVVHLDEDALHMHLIFVPVVHTKDKEGNDIEKICARDFWKGRDNYRKLRDAYFNHEKSKGFDLERGMFVEETGKKHYTFEQYKKITNFENTKKLLSEMKLELSDTPDITDIKMNRLSKKRDEKILEEIIKPKDDLIKELYKDNLLLHRELSKQSKLEEEFEEKSLNLEYEYKGKYNKLGKENNRLHTIIDKFYDTVEKFIDWICHKFGIGESKDLIKDFQEETHTFIDPVKQLDFEKNKKN